MNQEQVVPERRAHVRRVAARRARDHAADAPRFLPPTRAGQAARAMLLEALLAVRAGDFEVRLPCDWTGIDGKIADALNDIVGAHARLARAIGRVSVAVGDEGRLGQRLAVDKNDGAWGEQVAAINSMVDKLAQPVRETGRVIGAVAHGVLRERMLLEFEGRPLQGEFLKNAQAINTMLDQLDSFSTEVTRVAREVGTEGKLGGQARIDGLSGAWRDLTDNVNLMASNLTGQVRNIAEVTTAVARGDLSHKITVDVKGEIGRVKDTINLMVDQLNSFAGEVTRVAREVGTEGKLGGQAEVMGVSGVWKDLTESVNLMASNLTDQVRNIAEVTTAVARGDLSRKISADARGEILRLKDTINLMVDQLNSFAGEVTRVAREVGTEGKLGGQAEVKGVAGVWKDLTDNVNLMAANLTDQVRGMAKVVNGVAVGKINQKMMVPAKGEVAALADTINDMVDNLATFCTQVTRVACEVGVEGRLGGQALVPGAAGSWKDAVDNVNELAANLTTQVRAIGEVAIAVTRGDLERSIQVAARGEVADLKDNVNQMILNLKETTQRNTEQDWLKTNLARLNRLLQGQRDLQTVARMLLSEMAPLVRSQHAVIYQMLAPEEGQPASAARLCLMASYGYQERKNLSREWHVGEGVVGQAALEKERILIGSVPDDYVQIVSGLGQATPRNIVVLPILFKGQVKAVIELAAFEPFQAIHLNFLDQLAEGLGIVFNSIETASGSETLLRQQAEKLEGEFKQQQAELQETNAELERKARQLLEQNAEVERKNREIEDARVSLQEKAEQLALTSKYKSEFLANMSHELRSPLNSLLLLAEQLAQNRERNLSERQLEMVKVMDASGRDLLHLINDILDLSKIEAGGANVEIGDVPTATLASELDKSFRYQVEAKGLAWSIDFAPGLPALLRTDGLRIKQLLTNLLSNALKFTSRGSIRLSAGIARSGWSPDHPALARAPLVLAFRVRDTGIGIAPDKRKLIFEAFQQADASTSRRYGGTGLGLAISREIARLLDGELEVESEEGLGSTFTFYLPQPRPQASAAIPGAARPRAAIAAAPAADPAPAARADHPQLLIIEDDPVFARTLQEMALERGFATLHAATGEEGLQLARRHRPAAITLDLGLPDVDGWEIADRLRADPATGTIPVHVISIRDRPLRAARHGVSSYTTKPADLATLAEVFAALTADIGPPLRVLLLIENDQDKRDAIIAALAGPDRSFDSVSTAAEALAALQRGRYQGIVIELDLPDLNGMALLERIRSDPVLPPIPAVLYTERTLDREELERMARLDAAVVGDQAHPLDGGTAAVASFLQRVKGAMPAAPAAPSPVPSAPPVLPEAAAPDALLNGKTVLIVDDDARNLFALTGLLESHGMVVQAVDSGEQALRRLDAHPGIDIVLMDIMMPDIDGYEATRRIRADPRFGALPVIALTAKAMLEDRSKCLAAGASDYATKPVDTAQLLAQLRVWLGRRTDAAPQAAGER
ncbi:response regulator [Massilia niastensis]|uniref:response regulator n=1 Tax=Massilia niastensis TaxID=544911 RepID=UPI0003A5BCBF|nr:response regulator [Massilia niastensis]